MRIEEHEDYCEICEQLVPDGGTHSDEKHGSGRYGLTSVVLSQLELRTRTLTA